MNLKDKKIGIFGGAFDPIHMGHLILAQEALDKLSLDRILFMPTPSPYHRTDKSLQPLEDRINMVRLAIEDNERFELSDLEISLPGPTYTVNTLKAFRSANPDCEIYLIIGGDTLFSIENWYQAPEIFKIANIASARRCGQDKGESGSCGAFSDAALHGQMSEQQMFLAAAEHLRKKFDAKIYDIDMPDIEISSSDISRRIHAGESIRYYVPEAVRGYIYEHRLYGLSDG